MQILVSLMVDIPASADINEIEHRVQEAGRQAVRVAEEQRKTCPHCGSEANRSEGTNQRIILTKFRRVALPLRRQRCQGCQRRFRPADECLKSLQGGNVTAALREAGASFPYATAAQVVNDLYGAQITPIVSEMEPVGKRGRRRMSSRRYVATFETASVLGRLGYAAACQLQAEEAPIQVGVGDGSDWIKTEADVHFPQAVKILDWPHLWRKVHAGIRAVHPGQSKPAREWRKGQYETLSPLLWQGQVDGALTHLHTLRPGANQEPIDKLEEAITYVDNQRDWIGNYQQWQEAGYPVGSGLVDRGVAVVINPRLKRRGMRW